MSGRATRTLLMAGLLTSAVLLTGCGSEEAGTGSSTSGASAQANDTDIGFLTDMRPHHEQAVEMSDMVLMADPPAAVAALAQRIRGSQDPEIDQMSTMLDDLGVPTDRHRTGADDMAGHDGMMSESMMAELDDATGADAARRYLEGMIRHHQGAIDASDTEIADGEYGPATALAATIRAAQAAELTTMQALLQTL